MFGCACLGVHVYVRTRLKYEGNNCNHMSDINVPFDIVRAKNKLLSIKINPFIARIEFHRFE